MSNRYLFNEVIDDVVITTSMMYPKEIGSKVLYLGKIYSITSATGAGKSFSLGLYNQETNERLLLKDDKLSMVRIIQIKD